jgi:hypothetical protein
MNQNVRDNREGQWRVGTRDRDFENVFQSKDGVKLRAIVVAC